MLTTLIALYAALQFAILLFAHFRQRPLKLGALWIVLLLLAIAGWAIWVNDSAAIFARWPNKYGIVIYNFVPLFVALLSAVMIALHRRSIARLVVYVLLALFVDAWFWSAAFYNPIHCEDRWAGSCCLQTTDYTCVPAAAATLLKINGIDSNEEALKTLCLTRTRGTSLWGLYRGLREKTDGREKRVTICETSISDFLERNKPAIVFVMLDAALDAKDKRYSRDWGWTVNVAHAVVFLEALPGNRVAIADPKFGVEVWNTEGLEALWQRKVVYLEDGR